MQRIYLLLLLVVGLLLGFNAAAQPHKTWEAAHAAYIAQDYATAIARYDSLHQQQWHDAHLYYNLANAHFQLGHIGAAILNYDRAKRLQPHLPQLAHNLALAENACRDNLLPAPTPALIQGWRQLFLALSTRQWSILALIAWLGLGVLTVLQILRQRWHWWAMVLLFVVALLAAVLAYSRKQYTWHSGAGVIQDDTVALHLGADADSEVRYELHEGTRFRRIDAIGDWYKVRLPNGEVGWLPRTSVALLFE